jgi:hypothetical protein
VIGHHRSIEEFGAFVKRHQTEKVRKDKQPVKDGKKVDLGELAGDPVVPVVLLVPKDHGYVSRPYWQTQQQSFGYSRLEPRQGDAGIAGFFAAVFPGASFAQDAFPFGAYSNDNPSASPWALSDQTLPVSTYILSSFCFLICRVRTELRLFFLSFF